MDVVPAGTDDVNETGDAAAEFPVSIPLEESTLSDAEFDASIPRARADIISRDIAGEVVSWSPTASEPAVLRPLSSTVLGLLDGAVSAGELVDDLSVVLEVDRELARNVLRNELSSLDRAGLLTTSESWEPPRAADIFPAPPDP